MTRGQFRAPGGPHRVVFDGQSYNNVGLKLDLSGNRPYPDQVMSGRRVPWANVAISGTSWTDLATTAATRTHAIAGYADKTILVMCGGQSDIWSGDSGQQVYDDAVAYAAAARAAGYSHVVATTLIGNSVNDSSMDDERLVHNALLLANGEGAFDAVVDIDVEPIDDWTDTAYYFDGVHWWETGAAIAASLVAPVLDDLLAA